MKRTRSPQHTPASSRGKRRILAATLAAVLVVSACSSPDRDADEALFDDRAEDASGGDESSDSEESFAPAPTASNDAEDLGGVDEDASSDPMEESSDDLVEGESARDGGLFAPEVDEPSSIDENNTFENYGYRSFVAAADDPLSTFALDVDTGSWTIARGWLDQGQLPPIDSVRPEEWVNAFDYDYDAPRSGLDVQVDGAPSPFDDDNVLVRIGVQAEIVDAADRPDASLVFVVDTSGSMDRNDRLGLVKDSLEVLVEELGDGDTVAIVTYDNRSGIVLEPTPATERDAILDAIDDLRPGGSTNLEAGLELGYDLAAEMFVPDGINRVVLASDGVANVGTTEVDALAAMIRDDADEGINLVTVGFGMGNYNDVTMEQLADQGDGFYAYVDSFAEAERLFADELTSTLLTVARDAKIQVEFDADVVEAYRLIGFENRGVLDRDFRNDDVDAGELGAGHQVTALYEIELARGASLDDRDDLGEVFLRWEDPTSGSINEIRDGIDPRDLTGSWGATADDMKLATLVATFAEVSRDNDYAADVELDDLAVEIERLADDLDRRDPNHDAVEQLLDLVETAARLS